VTGLNGEIRNFNYDNNSPWPEAADGDGPSIVLIDPMSNPNHVFGTNWRLSKTINGNPGSGDGLTFADWLANVGGTGAPGDDPDKDSLLNVIEYALNGAPSASSQAPLPVSALQLLSVNGSPGRYLTLTYTRQHTADDIDFAVEFSPSVAASWEANGVLLSSTLNPNGTVTETWRSPTPVSATAKQFGRVKVTLP
jgi:hypothetical protein